MDQDDTILRAAGLLIGLALADEWSATTEIALCVADAAATGLPLDDPRAIDLLWRNLRDRRATAPGGELGDAVSADALLAACAVVALAHHRDTRDEQESALRAVLAVLGSPLSAEPEHLLWTETVAALMNAESFDVARRLREEFTLTSLRAVADAVQTASAPPAASPQDVTEAALDPLSSAMRIAPGATGALVGALFGIGALPGARVARLSGWPDADGAALVQIARDVAARRERGLPGVGLPVAGPAAEPGPAPLDPTGDGSRWRVVRVALTALATEGAP